MARNSLVLASVFFLFCLFCGTLFGEDFISLSLGSSTLRAEIVCTQVAREKGLQNREHIPENYGMLFVFPHSKSLTFWMKNTVIPLDIAFIDSEGYLFQIESMKPLSLRPVRSLKKCLFALEVRHGWFQENRVTLNTSVPIPETLATKAS